MLQSLEGLWPRKKGIFTFWKVIIFPMFDIAFVIVFHMDLKHLKKKKKERNVFNMFLSQ